MPTRSEFYIGPEVFDGGCEKEMSGQVALTDDRTGCCTTTTTINWKPACDLCSFTLTYLRRVGPRIRPRSHPSPTRRGSRQHPTYACPETNVLAYNRQNRTSTNQKESFPSSKHPRHRREVERCPDLLYSHPQRPEKEPHSVKTDM